MTQAMTDTNEGRVVLVHASKSRPPGPWPDDDYDVRTGSVCPNSFSGLISGTSAGFRLPRSAVAS